MAKAAVIRLSFRERLNNVHGFDIFRNRTFMHLRTMNTQMALRRRNKTTIRTLYKQGLRHNETVLYEHRIKLIEDNTATVGNTGIPHNRQIYSKDK